MKRTSMLILAALALSCASIPKPLLPVYQENAIPEVNSEQSKEIGETLVLFEKAYFVDVLKITESVEAPKRFFASEITKGSVYTLKGKTKEYDLYYNTSNLSGIAIPLNGSAEKGFIKRGINGIDYYAFRQKIKYSKQKISDPSSENFKKEFIFNGKSGNNLKFTYREYVNDMARPAYQQDLQYDLAESSVIGFKGIRMEVLQASNTNIKYKLLSNFN